jgi:hypothetical protein
MDVSTLNNTAADFDTLWKRMDDDLSLCYLEKFILRGKNLKPLENVSNITLNDPRVFADAAMSILSLDKRTIDITGIDAAIQADLEKELTRYLYVNDERLSSEMIEPLDDCFNWFGLMRGWIGALPLMYQDGKKYLPVIRPLDPRWMTWEVGSKGLKWGSYRIRADREEAEELYKRKLGGKKFAELTCAWDDKDFIVYQTPDGKIPAGDLPLKTIPHKLGICPLAIVPVPTQPLLISGGKDTQDALSRQGESIYAPVRTLIPAINEVASIWATINRQQFQTPMVYHGTRDLGEETIYGFATVIKLNPGEALDELKLRDMTPSAQALFGQLFARWERATMSSVNFGQLSLGLSALAVADLKSDRDKVLVPRRRAKTTMYRKIFDILRRQITGNCYKTNINGEDAIEIDKSLFQKKFTVKVSFDSVSPQENVANAQLSQQWKALGMPMEWILRNIIKVDDPPGVLRQAKLERLYNILPTLELADSAIGLDPRNVTEERINSIKAELIIRALEAQLSQTPGSLPSQPNPASQAKVEGMGRLSEEKLAAEQARATGVEQLQKGQRSKLLG